MDLTNIDLDKLSTFNINGRQIKNVIRLSQTVDKSRCEGITTDLIAKNIMLTSAFMLDEEKTSN